MSNKKTSLATLLESGSGFSSVMQNREFNLKGGISAIALGANQCNCVIFGNDCQCNGKDILAAIPDGYKDNMYEDRYGIMNNCSCYRTLPHPIRNSVSPSAKAMSFSWPEMF